LSNSLGNTKVDNLGHRLIVLGRDQDIRRLHVSMNNPFLVGMMDGLTDLLEESQPLLNTQHVVVTIVGNR